MDPEIRLLLVEDDTQLGRALQQSLLQANYACAWVRTASDAELHLQTQTFGLMLLDLGLPDASGLSVLKWLRAANNRMPTLILTARDSVEDRVLGLDEGADDYLVKPFAIPELLSRIRALLRRSAGFASRQWTLGDLEICPEAHQVRQRGEALDLSPREFQVLLTLARNTGRVVTRTHLEEELFDLGFEPESNALEVHIHHLRRKLGAKRIRTIRGLGYALEETP